MEEPNKETVILEPSEIIQPVKPTILRDAKGRFPAGVCGNPKGRPKGKSFNDIIMKVLEEGLAGVSLEEFIIQKVKEAYAGDPIANRFISDKTDKPKARIDIGKAEDIELFYEGSENLLDGGEEDVDPDEG